MDGDEREGEKKKKTIGLEEVKRLFGKRGMEFGEMEREREEEILDFRRSEERNRIGQKEERWRG